MDWEQDDDEDNSWSIRDLDHAPEPPPSIHSITGVIDGSLSSSAVSAVATAHVSPRPPHHHPYHHHFGNSNKTLLSSIVAAAKHRLAPSLQQQQVDSHSLSTAQQQNYPHNPITTTTTSSAAAAMTSTNTSSGTINASSLTGVAGPTVTSTPPRPMPNRPNVLGLRDRVWSAPHSATNNNKNYYYNVNNNKSKNNNHSSSSSFIHSYSHPHYYYQPTTAEPFLSRQQRQEQEHKQQRARSASLPDSPTNMAKKQPQPSSPRTNNETLFSVAATTTTAAAPAALVEATTATDIRQPGMRSAGSSTSSSSRNHTYRNRQGGRIRLRRQRRTNSLSNTSSNYSSSSCPVPSVSFLPQLPTLFIPNLPQEDHEQQEVAATNDEKQAPPLPSTKLSFRAEKGEDNNNNNKDDHGDGVDEDVVDETENTTETGGGTMTESEIHGHSSEKKEDGNDTKTTSDMRERVDETGNNHHCREAQEVGNDPMIYSLESFNSLPDDNISTPSEDKQDDDDCNNDYIERRHEPELLDMDDDDINNKEHEEDDMGTILPWTKQTKSSKRTPLDDSSFDDHDEETNKDEGGGDVLEDLDESDHSVNPDSSTRLNSGKRRLRRPTMHQIASFVVMHAPCFWIGYGVAFLLSLCRRSSSGSAAAAAARLRRQPTDRAIVSRLNILVGLFALFQIGSALFFAIVTLTPNTRLIVVPTNSTSSNTTTTTTRLDDDNGNGDPRTANDDLSYYNNNNETMDGNETFDVAVGVGVGEDEQQSRSMLGGGRNVNIWNIGVNVILLGVEAFVLVLAALLTVRVVRNVNLVGAIRYLWVLLYVVLRTTTQHTQTSRELERFVCVMCVSVFWGGFSWLLFSLACRDGAMCVCGESVCACECPVASDRREEEEDNQSLPKKKAKVERTRHLLGSFCLEFVLLLPPPMVHHPVHMWMCYYSAGLSHTLGLCCIIITDGFFPFKFSSILGCTIISK